MIFGYLLQSNSIYQRRYIVIHKRNLMRNPNTNSHENLRSLYIHSHDIFWNKPTKASKRLPASQDDLQNGMPRFRYWQVLMIVVTDQSNARRQNKEDLSRL
ncbi:hypothetical protein TNIN_473781 [Trichonephila inaurata madagascariensis]|uniref:Uncharacterized protein n=1 Tax=Trichonephila inaurata madagascariensis TaxID=2747483 RepID=A0A8X6XQK9_9ARAC|nr:hypothetical protein TNIN_473781 [Trichonephila inaurata madagascariensis]